MGAEGEEGKEKKADIEEIKKHIRLALVPIDEETLIRSLTARDLMLNMLVKALRERREELELPEFDDIEIRPDEENPDVVRIVLKKEGEAVAKFAVAMVL